VKPKCMKAPYVTTLKRKILKLRYKVAQFSIESHEF
jgi:hypothetical protein